MTEHLSTPVRESGLALAGRPKWITPPATSCGRRTKPAHLFDRSRDFVRQADETRPPVRQVPRLRPAGGRNPSTCSTGPPTSSGDPGGRRATPSVASAGSWRPCAGIERYGPPEQRLRRCPRVASTCTVRREGRPCDRPSLPLSGCAPDLGRREANLLRVHREGREEQPVVFAARPQAVPVDTVSGGPSAEVHPSDKARRRPSARSPAAWRRRGSTAPRPRSRRRAGRRCRG